MRSSLMKIYLLSYFLLFVAEEVSASPPSGFVPDLSFHFVCGETSREDLEKKVESFLSGGGFRVLNKGVIQRQHDVYLLDTDMVALDQKKRMVKVRSVQRAGRRYAFYFYTEPPTKRFPLLEDEILSFVSKSLKCEIRQLAQKENGAEKRAFYESDLERVRRLFENADQIRGGRRI